MLNQAIALFQAGRNADAVQLIRQVAASGEPEALGVLAEMTWRGGMVEQDPRRARILYEQAATRGNANASLIITNLLASGVAGKQDWSLALDRLRVEARQIPARRKALNLIEAMAFGLPILTTKWRSIPELFPADYIGLVRVHAPAEIADTLVKLCTRETGEGFRNIFLREFTLERHLASLVEAFRSVDETQPSALPQMPVPAVR